MMLYFIKYINVNLDFFPAAVAWGGGGMSTMRFLSFMRGVTLEKFRSAGVAYILPIATTMLTIIT